MSYGKRMFTGLIEATGKVRGLAPVPGGQRLTIETDLASSLALGDSVATSGVCLTVVALEPGAWSADVSPETLRVTALGSLAPGSFVNLERPLAVGSRLGGHFVQGHVDGTGRVEAVRPEGDFYRVTVSYPAALAAYFIEKGSVAVDGISLTVAALADRTFDVQIIPHTWTATTLRHAVPGTIVNLECDMVGKYVLRSLSLGTSRA
ncbi:riboflavin synthase [Luteitalea sp. TBR-22]|uniref:riboflavin synthase n=1 Tax=Luteitalea sp. TBR-22 TaxID=2802971 RepID=UPI001AF89FDC|nr:riboflavin synthase [Luteitalea sp. TBR-22]BCS33897.1 riboflavin synthase [Luteitalea sp. TBR-22]